MSGLSRLKNRRFIRTNIKLRTQKALARMSEAKKKLVISAVVEQKPLEAPERIRVVNLTQLGKDLQCAGCKKTLSLKNVTQEEVHGLHSILTVSCKECNMNNTVHTETIQTINGQSYSSNNLSVLLGAVHSGVGHSALNKVLACTNIPVISQKLYKRYEQAIGVAIEEAAKESCKRAALEERRLVIENVANICKELLDEIAQDIYPLKTSLESCIISENQTNSHQESFDAAVGEIVNIVISYDMGWSKRGNGKSYDSLNGYGTIIGFFSKQILDYTT